MGAKSQDFWAKYWELGGKTSRQHSDEAATSIHAAPFSIQEPKDFQLHGDLPLDPAPQICHIGLHFYTVTAMCPSHPPQHF